MQPLCKLVSTGEQRFFSGSRTGRYTERSIIYAKESHRAERRERQEKQNQEKEKGKRNRDPVDAVGHSAAVCVRGGRVYGCPGDGCA